MGVDRDDPEVEKLVAVGDPRHRRRPRRRRRPHELRRVRQHRRRPARRAAPARPRAHADRDDRRAQPARSRAPTASSATGRRCTRSASRSSPGYEVEGDFYAESGGAAMQSLLALPDPPTAVFAAADMMAVGAIRAVAGRGPSGPRRRRGRRLRRHPRSPSSLSPPLTTIRQDMVGIGLAAGRALVEQIENPDATPPGADAAGRARRPGVLRRARRRGGQDKEVRASSRRRHVAFRKRFRHERRRSAVKRIRARTALEAARRHRRSRRGRRRRARRDDRVGQARDDVTLRVSLFGDFGYHDLYKQYEAAHPGVTIKEEIQDYGDHHTQLAQHIATGAGAADVEAIEVGFIPQFTAQPQNFVDLRQYGAAVAEEPLAAVEVPAGGRQGRRGHRPRHRRRQPRDLLPEGPVREGRPADQPRRGVEALADVAGVHRRRQALPGEGAEGHVLLRLGLATSTTR